MEINKENLINCTNCKTKVEGYKILINKKKICLCEKCLNALYSEIGKNLLPKSLKSILKKDNRILRERF